MSITIVSNNFSSVVGDRGFARFRTEVAKQHSLEFSNHYNERLSAPLVTRDRDEFFKKHDRETMELIESGVVSCDVASFCYQSESSGRISCDQAKLIYDLIKDCDEDEIFGYKGRIACTDMGDLQKLFKDCAENGGIVSWN